MAESKQAYIITYKPKDQRSNPKSDKRALFLEAIGAEVIFSTIDDLTKEAPFPSSQAIEVLGYDINEYELPVLMAYLSPRPGCPVREG